MSDRSEALAPAPPPARDAARPRRSRRRTILKVALIAVAAIVVLGCVLIVVAASRGVGADADGPGAGPRSELDVFDAAMERHFNRYKQIEAQIVGWVTRVRDGEADRADVATTRSLQSQLTDLSDEIAKVPGDEVGLVQFRAAFADGTRNLATAFTVYERWLTRGRQADGLRGDRLRQGALVDIRQAGLDYRTYLEKTGRR